MACFTLNGAIGQGPFDIQHQAVAKTSVARQTPPSGNPLWGIPVGSLSTTRERPVFSASRRPPASPLGPVPVAEAPPPKPAEPEQPPFTLVGTAIGKPQNVALIIEQTTKNLVRLHFGEAASGWYLRSVDLRAMTLEKNSQTVTLNLPAHVSVR
jgi:general secretion pathway protein N